MRKLEYPVLGIPVTFESDCDDVLDVVTDSFGGWDCLESLHRGNGTPIVARFTAVDGDEGDTDPHGHYPVQHVCPDPDLVIARSVGSCGVSDPVRREVVAIVTRALLADRDHFRESFLEALTFALLSAFDRHPVHAAAIANADQAVLLAGPSGSGKSSLAMTAYTAGLRVLGDDHVWIETEPKLGVWGNPRHIRLVANAATGNPREKTVVRLDAARGDPASYRAGAATVCVLARGTSASLERVDDVAIASALNTRVDPGFDRFPDRHARVVTRLAKGGGWRLTLSENPDDALPFLRAMLE
jgi:hypothetical protein